MERLTAIISGRVQGVMYRDFVAKKAGSLGLTGEVRNLKDGTVEVIAEGPHEKLSALLVHLKRGPVFAYVTKLSAERKLAPGQYRSFDIK